MWVTNTELSSQIVSSITQLKPNDSITLTSVEGGITVNPPDSQLQPGYVPILLHPEKSLRVTILITPRHVGMLRTMFMVRLVTGITIGRVIEVSCDAALDPTLPSIAAAAPFVATPKADFTPACEIVRAVKPRFAVTKYKFKLGLHPVPNAMRQLVLDPYGGIGLTEIRRRLGDMAGTTGAKDTGIAGHVKKVSY